jgi:hypothetical protein
MKGIRILKPGFTALLAAVVLGWCSSTGFAQDGGGVPGISGEADFQFFCATCHGEGGRGDGSKAEMLEVKPADLTKLSASNGGIFPRQRILEVIDGRKIVKAHGDRDMPVWGDWFKMQAAEELGGAEGDERTVTRRLERLVDYLETIQEK